MNPLKMKSSIRPAVLEEAAGWLIEFRSGEPLPSEQHEFDTWLRTSPEHVRAYLTLLPTWESGSKLDPGQHPSAATLIQWARNGEDNVVALGASPFVASISAQPKSAVRIFAIAAALILVVTGAYFAYFRWRNPTYTTGTGEQRSLTLTDGSTTELNSGSRVRVRFSDRERTVELLEGQALFSVARNPARPFIVRSGSVSVRAVGTQFDVYKKTTGTVVTVVEGRVAVNSFGNSRGGTYRTSETPGSGTTLPDRIQRNRRPSSNTPEIVLSAGEQFTVTPTADRVPMRVDIRTATAWTQRRLIFSATPLPEVAEEFNRHNTHRLIIEDPRLETLRINGVFSSTDPAALLGFLRDQPGIFITEVGQELRVSR